MLKYTRQVRALLSPAQRRVFEKLRTPEQIQDFLDSLSINFERRGEEGIFSPCEVLKRRRAQCFEGALFASASLAYHGQEPLLMDIQTTAKDLDHVVALFKRGGYWGAISKTNHPVLRWRDPVYTSPRELAMSYFHEYFLSNGKKTMRAYSRPFDLRRYQPERWLTTGEELGWLADALDGSRHFPIASPKALVRLRRASPLERTAMEMVEWKKCR